MAADEHKDEAGNEATGGPPGDALSGQLQSLRNPLTKAILEAFERVDWDELAKQSGDLRTGLARLAAGVAWAEQKRAGLPTEEARRHREAQHRSSLSLVANHWDEWRELMRTHREQIDAERGALGADKSDDEPAGPGPKTAREGRGWLDRIKSAARKSAD